jgi:dynein assembly factor 1
LEHGGYSSPELNESLYLHFSGFRRIENLEPYTALRGLWLDSNGITAIEGLAHLSELRCLFLQQNALTRISGLDALSRLQTLNLSGNNITVVEGLSALPSLTSLVLSKNSLAGADAIAHLTECSMLSSVDLTNNELEGDEENSVLGTLARMPALVNLKLTGNGVCRTTRHYRKTAIIAMPRLAYLDERPVFAPERAATEAWARGGVDAERAERAAQEERAKAETHSHSARFTAWTEEVRAKRARELAELNATRALAGEAPLAALPSKVYVSYTRASTRHVTEAAEMKRITEAAEKAYGPGGNGILFDTDGVLSSGGAAAGADEHSSSNASESDFRADGSGGDGGATDNVLLTNGLESLGSEDTEEAVEAELRAQIYRAENEAREAERCARAQLDAAVLEKLHAGDAARAALVAESLRLFNAANDADIVGVPSDDGVDAEEEDGNDDEDDAAIFEASRRAQKNAELSAMASKFWGRTGGTEGGDSPSAQSILTPAVAALASVRANKEPPTAAFANDVVWFQSLDNALIKLTSQAAFDFGKVSRGLQAAGAQLARMDEHFRAIFNSSAPPLFFSSSDAGALANSVAPSYSERRSGYVRVCLRAVAHGGGVPTAVYGPHVSHDRRACRGRLRDARCGVAIGSPTRSRSVDGWRVVPSAWKRLPAHRSIIEHGKGGEVGCARETKCDEREKAGRICECSSSSC